MELAGVPQSLASCTKARDILAGAEGWKGVVLADLGAGGLGRDSDHPPTHPDHLPEINMLLLSSNCLRPHPVRLW